MKQPSREQIQALINAAVTILIILISLFGYNVTVLDPAKRVILESQRFIAGEVAELNQRLDAYQTINPSFIAGANVTHFTGLACNQADTQTIADDGSVDASQGSCIPITAAAAVGLDTITGGVEGQIIRLWNTSANAIVFTDTGTLKLAGNQTLGQYDTLDLYCDGTNYIQFGASDN